MHTNTKTQKPLYTDIIEAFAKVDVLMDLMDLQDEASLFEWIMAGGSDVSTTARMFLCASLNPSAVVINPTMKEGQ